MYVTVEQPAAVVRRSVRAEALPILAVTPVGKVTRQHGRAPEIDGALTLVNLCEAGVEIPIRPTFDPSAVASPTAIVVPGEQELPPSEFCNQRKGLLDLAHGEVAQDPHVVALGDDSVPPIDESAIHRAGVGERPAGIPDDVLVAEMKVGREPDTHDVTIIAARYD
jgi:hypothetical protein